MKHVYTATIEGQYPVTLEQHSSGLFRVQYGKQMRSNLSYAAAARKFGECLLHAATCAGQYWCTEYRAAVCAVLAEALWNQARACALPVSDSDQRVPRTDDTFREREYRDGKRWLSTGDWLRAYFRREFGRSIANRWFN